MQDSLIKLIAIKIDFNFKKHLYLLNKNSQLKILNYKFKRDQNIAFASEILKYYYLAKYLGIEPKKIKIANSKYGRPFLVDNPLNIDFNISHSGEYVVMAIAYTAKVGIDIEQINYNIIPSQLANIVFSETEKKWVGDDIKKFFNIWTKKEAVLKAYGTGFGKDDFIKTCLETDNQKFKYLIYSTEIFDKYYISVCLNAIDYQ
ncbi:MAG TPA: 4'-phosphopantetheinyl transferase superfamily protein [Burkholderiales bacterium]|nr:4'-phosphopantetheinyl transferase superfamily protein [Burkholderiales bacterium]